MVRIECIILCFGVIGLPSAMCNLQGSVTAVPGCSSGVTRWDRTSWRKASRRNASITRSFSNAIEVSWLLTESCLCFCNASISASLYCAQDDVSNPAIYVAGGKLSFARLTVGRGGPYGRGGKLCRASRQRIFSPRFGPCFLSRAQ